MLLTLSTTHRPASDLGYLLAKHPAKFQSFELAFGTAHVFYTEASEERCEVALLLEMDPVGLVRGRTAGAEGLLDHTPSSPPFCTCATASTRPQSASRRSTNNSGRAGAGRPCTRSSWGALDLLTPFEHLVLRKSASQISDSRWCTASSFQSSGSQLIAEF
jgi:hypothetical protein